MTSPSGAAPASASVCLSRCPRILLEYQPWQRTSWELLSGMRWVMRAMKSPGLNPSKLRWIFGFIPER